MGNGEKVVRQMYELWGHAGSARADAAMTYCDQYPLDALPSDALNLVHLLYSWVTVSFAIECCSQPIVPDSGAAYLDCLAAPVP